MSQVPEGDAVRSDEVRPSRWRRLVRAALPRKVVHRWDRLPEGSQQDAAHYNLRSGL
jgi:hypothetical protein